MTPLFAILLTIIILGLALWLLEYVFTAEETRLDANRFDRQQYNEDQVCKMYQAMQNNYCADDASQKQPKAASYLVERTKE